MDVSLLVHYLDATTLINFSQVSRWIRYSVLQSLPEDQGKSYPISWSRLDCELSRRSKREYFHQARKYQDLTSLLILTYSQKKINEFNYLLALSLEEDKKTGMNVLNYPRLVEYLIHESAPSCLIEMICSRYHATEEDKNILIFHLLTSILSFDKTKLVRRAIASFRLDFIYFYRSEEKKGTKRYLDYFLPSPLFEAIYRGDKGKIEVLVARGEFLSPYFDQIEHYLSNEIRVLLPQNRKRKLISR